MFNFLAHAGHKHEAGSSSDLTAIAICMAVTAAILIAATIYLLASRKKAKKK